MNDDLIQDLDSPEDRANATLPSLAAVKTPVAPDVALKLIRQTAVALAEASHSGYVHKNLRPETILIQTDNLPVVLNFDAPIPQPGDEDWDASYLSPEQKDGKALDSRSNIYTLGLILYELIHGYLPDQAPDFDPLIDGRPPLTPQTQRIIETCCQEEPWARYQNFSHLTAAIDRALLAETTSAGDSTTPITASTPTAVPVNAPNAPIKENLFFNTKLLPIGIIIIFLALLALALVNSRNQGGSSSIPIFEQLPLILGGEDSPARQTREAGATATIQSLRFRLPSRTPTASPTPVITEEPPIAGVATNPSTPTNTPQPTSTPTSTSTNPPPPTPVPTETPTDTAVPSPSSTPDNETPPPPGITNTPPPPPPPTNSPQPTSPPEPTDLPEPTNTPQPTPTPPQGATPTPPIFPTTTPQPTSTPPI